MEAASPPLSFPVSAVQATGPPLRPQGSLPRSLRDGHCGPPLTPEPSTAPHHAVAGGQEQSPCPPNRTALTIQIPQNKVSTVTGDCHIPLAICIIQHTRPLRSSRRLTRYQGCYELIRSSSSACGRSVNSTRTIQCHLRREMSNDIATTNWCRPDHWSDWHLRHRPGGGSRQCCPTVTIGFLRCARSAVTEPIAIGKSRARFHTVSRLARPRTLA